jgi:hypothetical protein
VLAFPRRAGSLNAAPEFPSNRENNREFSPSDPKSSLFFNSILQCSDQLTGIIFGITGYLFRDNRELTGIGAAAEKHYRWLLPVIPLQLFLQSGEAARTNRNSALLNPAPHTTGLWREAAVPPASPAGVAPFACFLEALSFQQTRSPTCSRRRSAIHARPAHGL